MIQQALIPTDRQQQNIIDLVLDGLTSEHSKRAYGKALRDFLTWYVEQGRPGLNKATVQQYRTVLVESGLSSSTINLRLSAIRRLAREAVDNALIDPNLAAGIMRVKGVRSAGIRTGNWLTREQAQILIEASDSQTLRGLRDRAILALLIGTGIRRTEAAELTLDRMQQREGRWVIVDLIGKGNRVRSVPMPAWAKGAIDTWVTAAGINEGRIFRSVKKGDRLGQQMTAQAIYNVVRQYANQCGFGLAAHDLRRTFAKLAARGGAGLAQIQLSLGHASLKTTERYLGTEQDLANAPCDHLGLDL